jgi:hypothetical protein
MAAATPVIVSLSAPPSILVIAGESHSGEVISVVYPDRRIDTPLKLLLLIASTPERPMSPITILAEVATIMSIPLPQLMIFEAVPRSRDISELTPDCPPNSMRARPMRGRRNRGSNVNGV